ncbi:hypothetical protein EYR40_002063 [Pleurotus pulmonarius]|nr:hypothetical protein EYR36_011536 [Pleurotus pulmonarius]KAF4585226.1 hypothetical protein EYR40_002063 [Pleurotus pulmonarius]
MNASIGTAAPDVLKEVMELSKGISSAAEAVKGNKEWTALVQEIEQAAAAAKKAGDTALAASNQYVEETQKLCSTLSSASSTLAKMRSRSFLSTIKRLFRRDCSESELQQYRKDVRSARDFFEPLASTTVPVPDEVPNHTSTRPSGYTVTIIEGNHVQGNIEIVRRDVDSNQHVTTNTINANNTYKGASLNGISK